MHISKTIKCYFLPFKINFLEKFLEFNSLTSISGNFMSKGSIAMRSTGRTYRYYDDDTIHSPYIGIVVYWFFFVFATIIISYLENQKIKIKNFSNILILSFQVFSLVFFLLGFFGFIGWLTRLRKFLQGLDLIPSNLELFIQMRFLL